jgi:putative transposase
MARIARIAVPDLPHHVTQRANRREPVFFEADDYRLSITSWSPLLCGAPHSSLGLLSDAKSRPPDRDADGHRWVAGNFAEAHRRYTWAINARFGWTGHLFQGRFWAVVLDEPHLLAAARCIALNPVVAGLVSRAGD